MRLPIPTSLNLRRQALLWALVLWPSLASALTFTWTGGTDGNFSTGSNWDQGTPPGVTDTVLFTGFPLNPCSVDVNFNVGNVVLDPSFFGSVNVAPGVLFQVQDLTIQGGDFNASNGTTNVRGNFSLNGGTFDSGITQTDFRGDFIVSGGLFNHGGGTVSIDGSVNQAFSPGPATLNNVQIFSGGGIVTLMGSIELQGTWDYGSGTVDPGSSTLDLLGGTQQFLGNNTFFKVNKFGVAGDQLLVQDGATLTVLGQLQLKGVNAGQPLLLDSINGASAFILNAGVGPVLQYLSVGNSTSTAPVTALDSNDLGGNINWSFVSSATPTASPSPSPSATPTPVARTWTGTVSNVYSNAANWSGGVPGPGDVAYFSNCINTVNFDVNPVGVKLQFVTGYTGIIGCSVNLSPASLVLGAGTFNLNSFNLTTPGDVIINGGTLNNGVNTLTLAGNLRLLSGSFVAGSGSVVMNGATQALDGNFSLVNFLKKGVNPGALIVNAGAAITCNNFSAQGAPGLPLLIRTTVSGTYWTLNGSPVGTLDWTDIADMHCQNARNANNSVSAGGNLNINFVAPAPSPTVTPAPSCGVGSKADLAWSSALDLPVTRVSASVADANGIIYVIGGTTVAAGPPQNSVYAFDTVAGTWSQKAPLSVSRSVAAAGVIDGKIYLAGGRDATCSIATLSVYDPTLNSWSNKAPMPLAIQSAGCTVFNRKLYVFGGEICSNAVQNKLFIYDPDLDVWSSGANDLAGPAREYPAMDVVNGLIHVVGGDDGVTTQFNSHEVYDPVGNSWQAKAPLPFVETSAGGIGWGGQFLLVGGGASGVAQSTVMVYDPVADQWNGSLAAFSVPRKGACIVRHNDSIHVIAGVTTGNALTQAHEVGTNLCVPFSPTPSPSLTISPSPSASPSPTPACGLSGVDIGQVGTIYTNNQLGAQRLNLPGNAVVSDLRGWFHTSPGHVYLGLYTDNAGYPGSLLSQGGPFNLTTDAQVIADIPDILLAGGNYWVAFVSDGPKPQYSAGSFANMEVSFGYGTLPALYPGSGIGGSGSISLAMSWCPSGQAPTVTATPSQTVLPSFTATPSATATVTPSASPTATSSATASASPSASPTITPYPNAGINWTLASAGCNFGARYGLASVVFNNKLWIIGGHDSTSPISMHDVWSSSDGINWVLETASAAFSGRFYAQAVVLNGEIWLVGGTPDGIGYQTDVYHSSDGVNWTQATAAAPFTGRQSFALFAYAGKLWVAGGRDAVSIDQDVWSSSDGATWVKEASSTAFGPRTDMGFAVFNGKMWVTGGYNDTITYNDSYSSTDGVTWTNAGSTPFFKNEHAAVAYGGRLWVTGGQDVGTYSDVWSSADGASWVQATAATEYLNRYFFGFQSFNNQLWVLGGRNNSPQVFSDVWYSPLSGAATPVPTCAAPLPTATAVPASTWRVNCGGLAYTDGASQVWSTDAWYNGGLASLSALTTTGTADPVLYHSNRYGNPFSYAFSVPAGVYQVTLKFTETTFAAAGQRVFDVSINGSTVLSSLDLYSDAGGQGIADDKVFNNISPVGGLITIQFGPASVNNAKVNAIEIIPDPSTPTPTVTPTATSSASPSATASASPSATPSASPSATATASPSATPSASPSATASASPTASPSATPSATATASPSATPSASPSATASASPSATPSATGSATASASPSATATASASASPTATPSATATATPCGLDIFTSLTLTAGNYSYCHVHIYSGGTLFIHDAVAIGILTGGDFTLDAGGAVQGTGYGSPGGDLNLTGSGTGAGAGVAGSNGGGGAGHGGAGGKGGGSGGNLGGPAFDVDNAPMYAGSGGGGSGTQGGAGGASLLIDAVGSTVLLNGTLNVSGKAGVANSLASTGGGGAGGTVYIAADSIGGNGTVQAVGGGGGATVSGAGGGGGAGGRIKLCASVSMLFTGTVSVQGAPGAGGAAGNGANGEGGSYYLCSSFGFTPTSTFSATPSASPTATASATATATPSSSPTMTPSATGSMTPSQTASATVTATPSASPSATVSSTATSSPTATPSGTGSMTPSRTPSATQTSTQSATASASPSATPSATASATASATPSQTPLVTATATPSSTPGIPVLIQLSPGSGLVTGGYSLILSGSDLGALATVSIGGNAATVVSGSFNSVTVTVPSGTAGSQIVVLTMPGGLVSNSLLFSYLLPTPTITPTATRTLSPSLTPTITPSGTRTQTPYVSPTLTPTISPTFTVSDTPLPTQTPEVPAVLSENVWHPAQGPLHIGIKAPDSGRVRVSVYNTAAERVRRPFDADVTAGQTADALWDGRNEDGEPCVAGVYIVSVRGAGVEKTLKVVLLK